MKKRKKCIALLLTLTVLSSALLTGCSSNTSPHTAEGSEEIVTPTVTETPEITEEKTSDNDIVKFTDDAGREVEIPTNIERIACTGTLAQIILFALVPDKFVGLSGSWSDSVLPYLDDKYKALPVFGQFYGTSDLNMEALAAADPQIIIDMGEKKESIVEDLDSLQEQLNIPVIFIEATTETMSTAYTTLGDIFQMQEEAKEISDYCNTIYTTTISTMEKIGDNKKTLLYCTGETGTNVIAQGSYHAEIIDLVSSNLAVVDEPSSSGSGNEIDMEQIILWNPEYIIFAPDSIYDKAASDSNWNQLDAIRNGNYYEVPNGPYNWMGFPPSVNRFMGTMWLCQLLYPDEFNYNLYEEAKKFYDIFYHFELTEDIYQKLTNNSLPE